MMLATFLSAGAAWLGVSVWLAAGLELLVHDVHPILIVAVACTLAVLFWLGPFAVGLRLVRHACVFVGPDSVGDRTRSGWRAMDLHRLRGVGVTDSASQSGFIPRTIIVRSLRLVDEDGRRLDIPVEPLTDTLAANLRPYLGTNVTVTEAARRLLDVPSPESPT